VLCAKHKLGKSRRGETAKGLGMSKIFNTLVNPAGTVARLPYWLGLITAFILFFAIFIVSDLQQFLLSQELGSVRIAMIALIIWIVLVLAIKRLRDADRSPLWAAFLVVPGVNFLAVLFIGTLVRRAPVAA
jgi:uncharacterized membrane protein YhaH (DUF805 family)